MFDTSSFSKAIAGGLVAVIVALAARYGFHTGPDVVTALGVIVTVVVSYLVGHLIVYLAPANKVVEPPVPPTV